MEESNQVVHEYIADTSVSDSLPNIIAAVAKTVELTGEIGAATSEQFAGAGQLGRAADRWRELCQ